MGGYLLCVLPRLLRLLLPRPRGRVNEGKKTHPPLFFFFPLQEVAAVVVMCICNLASRRKHKKGGGIFQEFAKKAPKAEKRRNNNGYKITLKVVITLAYNIRREVTNTPLFFPPLKTTTTFGFVYLVHEKNKLFLRLFFFYYRTLLLILAEIKISKRFTHLGSLTCLFYYCCHYVCFPIGNRVNV